MTILNEIGLENEYWLLDPDNRIIEAPKYNFPSDEIGFLIELRSEWSGEPATITATLRSNLQHQTLKANALGFEVECSSWKAVTKDWIDYIVDKYNVLSFGDYTRNVYGKSEVTQHTGFRKGRPGHDGYYATAGLHVHFSRWDTDTQSFVWFEDTEVEYIVHKMDEAYYDLIRAENRIQGEWEPKMRGDDSSRPHGFEYRSLPCTAPLLDVAHTALKALKEL